MKKIIYLIAAILLLAGCEKQIDFRGEESSPVVVLMSKPEVDSAVAVRLTYSRFFLSASNSFRVISNADVRLSANGTEYVGLFDGENYTFGYTAHEGDNLSLAVRMRNGGEDTLVTATTKVPYKAGVNVVSFENRDLRFKLSDRSGERNYYRVSVKKVDTTFSVSVYNEETHEYDKVDTLIVSEEGAYFTCKDVVLTENLTETELDVDLGGSDTYYRELLFTDETFDGREYEVKLGSLDGDVYYWEKGGYGEESVTYYYLEVESLTRDEYLYILSIMKQNSSDFFMTEPVQVQCNVENGIGLFAAKARTEVYVGKIEDDGTWK